MDLTDTYFTSVEMAGPGFLNFRLGEQLVRRHRGLRGGGGRRLRRATTRWPGRSTWWSSSPPTPPAPCTWATPAAACWATRWPACSQKSGADVWREFYVNDAGNQIEKFAQSPGGPLSARSSRARTRWSSPRTATMATISGSWPRLFYRAGGRQVSGLRREDRATTRWPTSALTATSRR